jgi:TonB family protein
VRAHRALSALLTDEEWVVAFPGLTVKDRTSRPPVVNPQPNLEHGVMRTATGDLPRGLVSAIVRASGCPVGSGSNALMPLAQVSFHPDGRPADIAFVSTLRDPRCQDAAAAVFRAAAAPLWRLTDLRAPDILVLPMDEESLGCVDESVVERTGPPAPAHVGGRIKDPRKVKDVPPVYPDSAKRKGLQGIVIIDAVISASGCVRDMRLMGGPPGLALPAMAAVGRWRYTPTLFDGVAVPVIMTVTVNFRLAY